MPPYLLNAVNIGKRHSVFPENAKVTSVVPLDKGKPIKNYIPNIRPVIISNTFLKIYEFVMKVYV